MSATTLPIEVWQKIFRYCDGESVVKYRRVCKFWKLAIDSLPNNAWKEIFIRERGDAEWHVKKSQISWTDMYKSVKLWNNVSAAKMSHKELPTPCVQQFQVLFNGVLAVVQNTSSDPPTRPAGYGNTIIYIDMATLEEIGRQDFDFFFSKYEENEKFITLIHEDQRLCVIPKANNKRYFVGELLSVIPGSSGEYTMCEKEVFYKRTDDMLCVSKVVEEYGEVIVKTEELEEFAGQHVIACCYAQNKLSCDSIVILTDEGVLYSYEDKELARLIEFSDYLGFDFNYGMLYEFGFDWTTHSIFNWLIKTYPKNRLKISKLCVTALYLQGNRLVLGTITGKIQIFNDPYTRSDNLRSYNGKPVREIHLDEIRPCNESSRIQQLDVIGRMNGHKILVLTNGTLVLFDLVNEEAEERCQKKRKAPTVKVRKEKIPKKSA